MHHVSILKGNKSSALKHYIQETTRISHLLLVQGGKHGPILIFKHYQRSNENITECVTVVSSVNFKMFKNCLRQQHEVIYLTLVKITDVSLLLPLEIKLTSKTIYILLILHLTKVVITDVFKVKKQTKLQTNQQTKKNSDLPLITKSSL